MRWTANAGRPASHLKLVSQACKLVFVSLLYCHMCLFEAENLLSDHLHLLHLARHLLIILCASVCLTIEFLADLIQKLIEPACGRRPHATMRVVHFPNPQARSASARFLEAS